MLTIVCRDRGFVLHMVFRSGNTIAKIEFYCDIELFKGENDVQQQIEVRRAHKLRCGELY